MAETKSESCGACVKLEHDRRDLVPLVFQAVGRATMSWEFIEKAGVFKDSNAVEAAEAILNYIRSGELPEWYS